jgi:integrase
VSVRKLDDGGKKPWLAEVYPSGRDGPRKRKRFATKGEGTAWENWLLEGAQTKPWISKPTTTNTDTRTLLELIELWFGRHGRSLVAGENIRSILTRMAVAIGNPIAADFTVKDFANYRDDRLAGRIIYHRYGHGGRNASLSTINHEHSHLTAMFNELIRLGEWSQPNPLNGLRQFRLDENERGFLTLDEIDTLLTACANSHNPDLLTVVKLCLATGARWSEVEEMTSANVSPGRLTFMRTKGKKHRTVPISDELYQLIPKKSGRLFSDCYDAFRKTINRSDIELPDGQCSHVLRHTFASHFMMNGGNILVLQRILGHTSITMTMRYAHFAPDHLDEALRLNPLATAKNGDKMAAENNHPRR